ncbi:DUF3168 domain-containing protein [Rhizobium pusense]|jgi:hypothetical protein|uniref:DUF3168 domain-containing protein n=4 Tax=Bacteria TaxID=2 RepID=A0A1L9CVP7_9HYPH|nr:MULTISPECIES: DUF3168 domain-containing protein [Rhizobium/Agrobacterium group]AMD61227.1 hypothetical protein AWN88_24415 [Agrobacterium tumefaciens]ANV24943.1 hypothetical protein BA939_14015 [Rhizobium sp. S41]AUC09279.1 hypothetical protein BLX90_03090 [Rhizobium sp. Y9]EKJ93893.1 hypothetical protein C241_22961 [Bradyrhizobium lupini HPC(L)]KGE82123.1 hypothetical protein LW14_13435 [Rhizobium sp. H41]KIV68830.1 Hypothetical protein SZ54_0347 [Rhizobium sp. UR51a]MBB2904503.1 hypothe
MSAANPLLQAIVAKLAGDAELADLNPGGIVDRLLTRGLLPCIVFDEVETRDYSTATESAEEHFLTLQIWGDANRRRSTGEIAARVKALLDDAALPLVGFSLVNMHMLSSRSRREAKSRNFVLEMRFRAVTE